MTALGAHRPRKARSTLIRRHSAAVRVTHWINALCLALLLFSGLQIFNAHPALYWGQWGFGGEGAVVEIGAVSDGDALRGVTRVGGLAFTTTGVLGISAGPDGAPEERAFPSWLTIPGYRDLSAGRLWHFFFAWLLVFNGLFYLVHGVLSGHVRRGLLPSVEQLAPRHLLREIADHARLRFPKGEEARRYNTLQKLAYLAVVFMLLPGMVATGLAMSPGMDAAFPWLPDLFGGRQSARTLHFITASLLVLFVAVHVAMVVASGAWNNLRSMVTGRYAIHDREPSR